MTDLEEVPGPKMAKCGHCGIWLDLNSPHWIPSTLGDPWVPLCLPCAGAVGVLAKPLDFVNCRCVPIPEAEDKLECFGGPWDGLSVAPVRAPDGTRKPMPVARVSRGVFARALRAEYLAAVAENHARGEPAPVIVGEYVPTPSPRGALNASGPTHTLQWHPTP